MKKLILSLILCSFFAATSVFGQQPWTGTNINNETYRIGKVGINSSAPWAMLEIKATNYAVLGGGHATTPNLRLQSVSTTSSASNYYWDITGQSSLSFAYKVNTSSSQPVLNLSQTSFDYRGNHLQVGVGENRYSLGVANAPSNKSGHYLAFGADNTGGFSSWSFSGNSTNNGGAIIHGDNQGNLFFITRGTSVSNVMTPSQTTENVKMQIHSNGKISIGTGNTLPDLNENGDDYLLFIKGGTLSEEVAVKTGWADYVFDDNYELLPLEKVEQHIDIYGHLHNTPSADELDGKVKLGDATVQQQEKIEEIYLHLIEMNKRMKALEAENERLKAEMEELKK